MDNQNNPVIIEEKNQVKKQIKSKFVELSSASTSHGYPNIFRTKYLSIKILWVFSLMTSIGFCIFLLIRGINAYLEYGVVTNIEMIDERPVEFPTITVCDLDKFQTYQAAELIREIYYTVYNIGLGDDSEYFIDLLSTYPYVYKLATAKAANPSFGNSSRKKLAYDLKNTLFRCSYNNDVKLCNPDQFEWSYDYTYGNCYKFNSGYNSSGNEVPIKAASKPGYSNGLNMFFFNNQTKIKYTRLNVNKYQGYIVFIHDKTENPIFSNGIQVLPGTHVNIGIKKTITKKYPEPYSNCKDLSAYSSYFYDFLTQSNKVYRQRDCFDLLLQRSIINYCGCYDLQYPQLYNAAPCLSLKQLECAEMGYLNFWNNHTDSSECPLECDFVDFDFSYSTSDFDAYGMYLLYNEREPFSETYLEEFKKQTAIINVYFSDLRYTKITESPSTTIIDLFAYIGGTVGLFVGVSVLSCVEIVEFILEAIIIYFEKRKETRKYKTQNQTL
jgi:hypothetical protein